MTKDIRMDYSEYDLLVKRAERKSPEVIQYFSGLYYGTKKHKQVLKELAEQSEELRSVLGERIKALEEIKEINKETIYKYKTSTYILIIALVLTITIPLLK